MKKQSQNQKRKFFVQWVEKHSTEVIALNEQQAFKEALKKSGRKAAGQAEEPIIFAA